MIITTAIIKGGCAKTTTAAALAQAAAADGKKVLAVDLDPQASLTYSLNGDQNRRGAYELLQGAEIGSVIQHSDQGVDIVAGSTNLAAEKTGPGSANRLRDALAPIMHDYDLICIDTPPQLGEMVFNALQASEFLLIPLEADRGSLQGLYHITDVAKQIQETNPALKEMGIVLTRYDGRPKINRFMRDVLEQRGQEVGAPLLGTIRAGVAIREAQAMQYSLYDYAPKSKPAQDYKQLYETIMNTPGGRKK